MHGSRGRVLLPAARPSRPCRGGPAVTAGSTVSGGAHRRSPGEEKVAKHWEAWYGTQIVEAGTTREGKPRNTLVTLILVAHTKTDAKALAKAHPELKFIEREARDRPAFGTAPTDGAAKP